MIHPAYSTLKLAWHQERIAQFSNGGHVQPIELQLILSDLCNHDCYFCAYRASNGLSVEKFGEVKPDGTVEHNPKRMIPEAKALEILRDGREIGALSVIFTGGGEPTVHPQHMELFSSALDMGYDCALNTNGQVLRRGWEEVLPKFTYIRVSVDAANPAEYAAVRRVAPQVYGKVLGNIAKLVEACPDTTVGAGYVVTPENHVNLGEGLARLFETGVKYVRLAAMQSKDGVAAYPGDTWIKAVRAAAEQAALYGESVVNLVNAGLFGEPPDYDHCGYQHVTLYLGADLNVYRCCYTAYTDLGNGGSIKDRSLKEWWHDEERRKNYREFSARSCSHCPLDEKNRTINYLIDKQPVHINFV